MKWGIYSDITIGLICGIIFSSILFIPSLRSFVSDPALFLILFTCGFIAGLSHPGTVMMGALRGVVGGAVISAVMVIRYVPRFPGNNSVIDILFWVLAFSVLFIPVNGLSGIAGVTVRKLVFRSPDHAPFGRKDVISFAGICIGAGVIMSVLYLSPFIMYLFRNSAIIIVSMIIGGGIAGALSDGGIMKGVYVGILTALLVCFLLAIPLVLFSSGGNERTGFAMLGMVGLGVHSILVCPVGGVIGAFLKSVYMKKMTLS